MASIAISFDTVTKAMTASIDGVPVENVAAVDISPSWDEPDEYRCCLVTVAKDEATDIRTITQIVAADSVASKAGSEESVAFPGFREKAGTDQSKAHVDIAEFFKKA